MCRGMVLVVVLICATFIMYNGILNYHPTWCDFFSNLYGASKGVISILTSETKGGLVDNVMEYRPVFSMLLYFDYLRYGLDFGRYQLTNLVLHTLVVVSVFGFSLRFFRNWRKAFLSVMIFCVWSGHMWVVPYITTRADVLMTLFMLLTLITLDRYLERNTFILLPLSGMFSLLAYLSKGSAIILCGLVFFYIFLKKGCLKLIWPYIGIAAIWLTTRACLVGGLGGIEFRTSLVERILSVFVITAGFFETLIYPIDLFGLDKMVLLNFGMHDFSLLELMASIMVMAILAYMIPRFKLNIDGFPIIWIVLCWLFYVAYGKVSVFYLYSVAVPFSMVVSRAVLGSNRVKKVMGIGLITYFLLTSPMFLTYPSLEVGNNIQRQMVPEIIDAWKDIPSGSRVYVVNSLGLIKKHSRAYGIGAMNLHGLLKVAYPDRVYDIIEVNDFDVVDADKEFSVGCGVMKDGTDLIIYNIGFNTKFRRFNEIKIRYGYEDGFGKRVFYGIDVENVDGGQDIIIHNVDGYVILQSYSSQQVYSIEKINCSL